MQGFDIFHRGYCWQDCETVCFVFQHAQIVRLSFVNILNSENEVNATCDQPLFLIVIQLLMRLHVFQQIHENIDHQSSDSHVGGLNCQQKPLGETAFKDFVFELGAIEGYIFDANQSFDDNLVINVWQLLLEGVENVPLQKGINL